MLRSYRESDADGIGKRWRNMTFFASVDWMNVQLNEIVQSLKTYYFRSSLGDRGFLSCLPVRIKDSCTEAGDAFVSASKLGTVSHVYICHRLPEILRVLPLCSSHTFCFSATPTGSRAINANDDSASVLVVLPARPQVESCCTPDRRIIHMTI